MKTLMIDALCFIAINVMSLGMRRPKPKLPPRRRHADFSYYGYRLRLGDDEFTKNIVSGCKVRSWKN